MPTQVDGSGLDVDVHQVVDDLTLDVILDAVDEEPPTHINHLDEGQMPERRQQIAGLTTNVTVWADRFTKSIVVIYLSC